MTWLQPAFSSLVFDENAGMSSHPPDRFQLATDEREVVDALRDAMRYWYPHELAQIPAHCRPGKLRDGEDVANVAFSLTTTRIESDESSELLVKLETLFARACQRISELENGVVGPKCRDVQDRQ
jgi:hypothetical protein